MRGVRKVLVTGGAGFIGCNLVDHLLGEGHQVTIFDNLSRRSVERNVVWLRERHGDDFPVIAADLRDYGALVEAVRGMDVIYHLAAQTAVTNSLTEPRMDFEINAVGTFNALEAARNSPSNPIFLFSSTNKVYGPMEDVPVVEMPTRYEYRDHAHGISEARPLDFHSPYGCSKGAGDQYVLDYTPIYGLPTVVFRMSCIYGPRQFGTEDQGWVAHFIIATLLGRPITVYGDGRQVRDVLFIDDLVRAFDLAVGHIDTTAGQAYNIGGGAENTISIWAEFGELLGELVGQKVEVAAYCDWRPGDQLVYVSDIRKAKRDFGWEPQVEKREGIERLFRWVEGNRELF